MASQNTPSQKNPAFINSWDFLPMGWFLCGFGLLVLFFPPSFIVHELQLLQLVFYLRLNHKILAIFQTQNWLQLLDKLVECFSVGFRSMTGMLL